MRRARRFAARKIEGRRWFGVEVYGLWDNDRDYWANIDGWSHIQTRATVKAWARLANKGLRPAGG